MCTGFCPVVSHYSGILALGNVGIFPPGFLLFPVTRTCLRVLMQQDMRLFIANDIH
jgi:hypothetical protein